VDERIGNLIIFNWRHACRRSPKWTDEELAERLKKIPSKERREAWLRAARRPYTEEERAEARAKLVQMLDKMEETLASSAWLAGERYGIADIAQVPFVKRIDEEIAPDELAGAKHPRTAAWWRAIQARPAFARAKIGPFVDPNPR
jgi:glutathione S-transferase